MISDFLEACRFLTVLPVPSFGKKGDLARALFFFPLVGLLMGMLSLAATFVLSLNQFGRLEALALVTLPVLLSGGLHVDGFADFCDGFFSREGKEEILRIMRDSRIGVWGAVGTVLLLAWKWELLASVPGRAEIFIFSLMASRWSQSVLSYFLPYANPQGGLGERVARKVTKRALVGATGFLAIGFLFLKGEAVLLILALLPFLAGLGFLFKQRLGGITGDLLGAASESTELFVLLAHYLIRTGSF